VKAVISLDHSLESITIFADHIILFCLIVNRIFLNGAQCLLVVGTITIRTVLQYFYWNYFHPKVRFLLALLIALLCWPGKRALKLHHQQES